MPMLLRLFGGTRNFVAPIPRRFTVSNETDAPTDSEWIAAAIASRSAPASTSAPTVISPLMPEKASR